MKKFILIITAIAMSAAFSFAQDAAPENTPPPPPPAENEAPAQVCPECAKRQAMKKAWMEKRAERQAACEKARAEGNCPRQAQNQGEKPCQGKPMAKGPRPNCKGKPMGPRPGQMAKGPQANGCKCCCGKPMGPRPEGKPMHHHKRMQKHDCPVKQNAPEQAPEAPEAPAPEQAPEAPVQE